MKKAKIQMREVRRKIQMSQKKGPKLLRLLMTLSRKKGRKMVGRKMVGRKKGPKMVRKRVLLVGWVKRVLLKPPRNRKQKR
jgi:hypothetical protein